MINIIIADDHPIIRFGLRQIISEEKDMVVKGDAENGSQLLEMVSEHNFDILLLDLGLPDISGFQLLGILQNFKPELPVLVLSAYPEEYYSITALKSGASGYLNKITASEQLISAIKKVISGGFYISEHLAIKLVETLKKGRAKIFNGHLSNTDFEVMCLIASGKTDEEISKTLTLDFADINNCRLNIYNRAKISRDAELLRYCINKGFITS